MMNIVTDEKCISTYIFKKTANTDEHHSTLRATINIHKNTHDLSMKKIHKQGALMIGKTTRYMKSNESQVKRRRHFLFAWSSD
jgi:hypothetical protein